MTAAPQSARHHFVFLEPCGCPFGLVEAGGNVDYEADAWADMFEGDGAAYRAAAARGVTVVHVDHATYEAEFYRKMLGDYRCPHN